jgi:hypothetical protein
MYWKTSDRLSPVFAEAKNSPGPDRGGLMVGFGGKEAFGFWSVVVDADATSVSEFILDGVIVWAEEFEVEDGMRCRVEESTGTPKLCEPLATPSFDGGALGVASGVTFR